MDTLRVRIPYTEHGLSYRTHRDHLDPSTGVLTHRPGSANQVLPDGGVRLVADDRHGKFIAFEASVPRAIYGTNVRSAPLSDALAFVSMIQEQASAVVDWAGGLEAAEVARIDLVRDIRGVTQPMALLETLSRLPGMSWRMDRENGVQTLRAGRAGRWGVTAYDKHAERLSARRRTRDPALRARLAQDLDVASGVLRVEVGIRTDPLRERIHTNQLIALREDDLMAEAHHYFKRAGLAAPVGGGGGRVREAMSAMLQNPKDRRLWAPMLGYLMEVANGWPVTVSSNSIDTYRALARKYGVTAADLRMHDGPAVRIDWDSASVVMDAA